MSLKKVLVIDDDAELCGEIAELLREEGYAVRNTSDHVEGLAFLEEAPSDIVILDYKMPDTDGLALSEIIKDKHAHTKIVMMSGRPFIEQLLEVQSPRRIDAVLKKPFDTEDLLRQLRAL